MTEVLQESGTEKVFSVAQDVLKKGVIRDRWGYFRCMGRLGWWAKRM